jgi:hypothetical protein
MNTIQRIFCLAAVLFVCACGPALPELKEPEEVVWLEQGWSDEYRSWFHHASQGSAAFPIPYDWFVALEQPDLLAGDSDLLVNPDYFQRFGFIASKHDPVSNPDNLPIGFTVEKDHFNPQSGEVYDALGMTCAAYHTGNLTYESTDDDRDGLLAGDDELCPGPIWKICQTCPG